MRQMACRATLERMGHLNDCRYLLHDRDTKFCAAFRETLAAAAVKGLRLPTRSPNWNAFTERWVRSVQDECLSPMIWFGERSLRKAFTQFQEYYHYHKERNHHGGIRCRERLGGLLRSTAAPHEYFDQMGL
jgi:hypothetical protein